MYPEEPHDQVGEPGRATKVRRICSLLETPEAEAFVVTLELAATGQMEDDARLGSQECADDRSPDALPLPTWDDGDGCQLTAAIAVRLDLAHPDDLSVLLGHDEVWPMKVHRRKARFPDQTADRGLVGLGRGSDGAWHLAPVDYPGVPPTQPKECPTPPTPSDRKSTRLN